MTPVRSAFDPSSPPDAVCLPIASCWISAPIRSSSGSRPGLSYPQLQCPQSSLLSEHYYYPFTQPFSQDYSKAIIKTTS